MSKDVFLEDEPRSPQWFASIAVGVVLLIVLGWFVYSQFRIDVGTGEMAILIKKTGKDIPNAEEIAPGPEYKGVQETVLSEGRYFRNPYHWEWEVLPQVVIPNGKLGVKISKTGDDLGYGEFLARQNESGKYDTKGIVPEVLRPGRYPINPYLFAIEQHEPKTIPAGFKGVVTNLAGPFPKSPNELLVEEGERGVQRKTLNPGTYYLNPYVTRINLVDCRSQRFNLAERKDMGFPSKDGFWVSLDGVIEFRVDPEKAAEVFVIYNEDENGDRIDEEIVKKVIMPNARSFCRLEGSNNLGREFIQGLTRTKFQEEFEKDMREKCEPLGIEIIQALITRIKPPEQIAGPVRDREIAKQEEKMYQQQIIQQQEEQELAVKRELVTQKQELVKVEQEIVKLTTEAERMQEVAVTKANEELAVAQFKRDAAADEAAALLARGKADADVIRFGNEADAAGWKRAVEAFGGDGRQFARYVLFQKMSSAYRQIMVNTADSPIMKVFETFTEPSAMPSAPRPQPGTVTSRRPVPAGTATAPRPIGRAAAN